MDAREKKLLCNILKRIDINSLSTEEVELLYKLLYSSDTLPLPEVKTQQNSFRNLNNETTVIHNPYHSKLTVPFIIPKC